MDLSRFNWRSIMIIATSAMMIQQAFSYVCQIVMPILADRLAEEFGISRGWLGFYLALQNVVAIVAAVGCGGFILVGVSSPRTRPGTRTRILLTLPLHGVQPPLSRDVRPSK